MSHQIILEDPLSHDGIHDLESFWWILVHTVLTSAGPGKWREDRSKSLDLLIAGYFDGPHLIMAQCKWRIFARLGKDPEDWVNDLLKEMHPYFEPLRDLIFSWWAALKTGFDHEGYEYHNIHDIVLSFLNLTIEKLNDTTDEETEREDRRRRSYQDGTKAAILEQRCVEVVPISPKKATQAQTTNATTVEPESLTASDREKKRFKK
ncbi:hypothetical protein M422DRAFT_267487 [Sphaerobolus stellatus SS14]|uniref:Fungal-type protein kinase domain-containing protein n=1 Tax=Sphaerobolus stellatus (strain SS14) TaxID=990650 RepID=A0A0C9UPR9_SPHS4|nr:hypothetical protein M422DRAFT_267487 [Sphaerobolus stellatus SS14]